MRIIGYRHGIWGNLWSVLVPAGQHGLVAISGMSIDVELGDLDQHVDRLAAQGERNFG
jgi:hypothetical protein